MGWPQRSKPCATPSRLRTELRNYTHPALVAESNERFAGEVLPALGDLSPVYAVRDAAGDALIRFKVFCFGSVAPRSYSPECVEG
jgi:hypothetical protein